MALHTREQKFFIVRHLARLWKTPEIVAAFVREFPDTACAIEDIRAVDPERGCSDLQLVAAFDAVRAEFCARLPPISQRVVRLHYWQDILRDAVDRGSPGLLMEALRGAAAECGAGELGDGARQIREIVETIVDPAVAA